MADHIRKSAKNEGPRNSGAIMIAVIASVAAIIAGVVFLTTNVIPGGQTNKEEAAATQDAESDADDKKADDSKKSDDESTSDDKSDEKDEDEDESADADSKKSDDKDSADSQTESATIGNAMADKDKDESADAQSASTDEGSSSTSADEGSSSTSSESGSSGSDTSSSNSSSGSGSIMGPSSSASSTPTAAYTSADGWITAEACATEVAESGTITASEIPFDDDIPQVGLDTASYPYSHFGKYVEIQYGDVTVTAQVVDCGAYNGGTSGIVLNPAVFYEFGVGSVYDWGRREVSYRFV